MTYSTALKNNIENSEKEVVSLKEQIDRVSGVAAQINAVTRQTNLLALNATIEAARAGESGKGFAVVASEVKQLATTTDKSANAINGILANMTNAIEMAQTSLQKLQESVSETTKDSAENITFAQEINSIIVDSEDRASKTSEGMQDHLSIFTEVVEKLEQIKADTHAAIEGAENNIKLTETAEQKIENIRHSTA